ncbi:MAG: glycosyltransferase family 9 protein [Gammaproteobacteria bacterium]|nr:glycosyltransferase family 9 protein [Gammaproteobacteria bacterium]
MFLPPERNNFLFITLSNIGDVLLTTPVLQFLHGYDTDARIDIIGDKRSSMLFRHCPYRGQVYHKHKRRFLRGVPSLWFELRRNRYDLVVDLRTDILARLVRADKRLGKTAGDEQCHAVEQHFAAISPIAGGQEIPPVTLWLGQVDRDYAARVCRQLPGNRWLCIGPGANWEKKIWPAEKYALTADELRGRFDALVLLGNDSDNRQAELVAGRVRLPCVNLCGRTTLLQAGAVMERMTLFLGNDSGLGHVAAAVGAPSFTLFGPGNPERYHPWGPRAAWLAAPDGNIENIPVNIVVEKVREHLTRISNPSLILH